ncbi:RNA polymerase sigma factor SigJ [Paenibacillus sp. MWE-103]|uniref:RNA polymerase sigma factor SigJ n=1 Tax=Paenibacillus artemisiicola TaxID=1172618 RepID=A0ABS3W3Z9_9BACL|nr:RNA polymerase sigma factor SigJ [Paenibacillus artemisiicola]MBO7743029.1 RNA polymerase sigma factor SigJ [Paenibacillus artemisiicola]
MEELFKTYNGLLLTLAYQMTGSWSDAEDAVQDVFLKVCDANQASAADDPKAYLCKMVVNRCRDLYKSARRRRERYFGEWLPEPVPTSEDEPLDFILQDELLSYATLVMLEKLSPAERAVFVLREALAFEYAGIAEIIGKSEVNCRKLYSRAKSKMALDEEQPVVAEPAKAAWIRQFVAALEQDNTETVVSMLADDVVLVSDGGGNVFAAAHPIAARDAVSKFLIGYYRKSLRLEDGIRFAFGGVNGQTGIVVYSGSRVDSVVLLHAEGSSVRGIYIVRNPDKLRLFASPPPSAAGNGSTGPQTSK